MGRVGVLLAAVALVASGCEDVSQRDARQALQAHLRAGGGAGYDVEDAHCTRGAREYFQPVRTTRFVCTVRRLDGDCDWFRVELREGAQPRASLLRRRAGCVLPA